VIDLVTVYAYFNQRFRVGGRQTAPV